jgi:hypothetical protein
VLVDYSGCDGLLAGGRGAEGSCAAGWRNDDDSSMLRSTRRSLSCGESRTLSSCGLRFRSSSNSEVCPQDIWTLTSQWMQNCREARDNGPRTACRPLRARATDARGCGTPDGRPHCPRTVLRWWARVTAAPPVSWSASDSLEPRSSSQQPARTGPHGAPNPQPSSRKRT